MGSITQAKLIGALCALALTNCRETSSTTLYLWSDASIDAGADAGTTSAPATSDASTATATDSSAPFPVAVDAAVQQPTPSDAQVTIPVDAARPRSLRVGVQPTPAGADAGALGVDLAVLESLALGSQAMTLRTLEPLQEKALLQHLNESAEVDVILTLPVALDDAASLSALPRMIDEAMALFEQDASFSRLVIGERLDKQWGSDQEQAPGVSAVATALNYAHAHPQRPADVTVGVGLAASTTAGRDLPEMWAQGIHVYALSFDGLNEQGQALSPAAAVEHWQQTLDAVSELGMPVVFQEVSYPSAEDQEAQRAFFTELRNALAEPPMALEALVISALNDPPRGECQDWAERWFPKALPVDLRCSIGLHDQSGNAKPAMVEVLEILARHATP